MSGPTAPEITASIDSSTSDHNSDVGAAWAKIASRVKGWFGVVADDSKNGARGRMLEKRYLKLNLFSGSLLILPGTHR